MALLLLGASGTLGRAIAAAAAALGHEVTGLATTDRSGAQLADAVRAAVRAGGVEAVVPAAAIDLDARRAVAVAALAEGVPVLDTSLDPQVLRWARDEGDAVARAGGTALVVGAGVVGTVGDLLAAAAIGDGGRAEEVHVTYALPDRGALRSVRTAGVRRDLASGARTGAPVRVHGADLDELPGEVRRLAWFPRPVGPTHAAGITGAEPVTVPRWCEDVAVVRTYLALRGWRAELLQASAQLARGRRTGPWLARRQQRAPRATPGPSPAGLRWACVVEVASGGELTRAWANGGDLWAAAGTAVVGLAAAVGEAAPVGLVAPAQVLGGPGGLDLLGVRADVRWSVRRP